MQRKACSNDPPSQRRCIESKPAGYRDGDGAAGSRRVAGAPAAPSALPPVARTRSRIASWAPGLEPISQRWAAILARAFQAFLNGRPLRTRRASPQANATSSRKHAKSRHTNQRQLRFLGLRMSGRTPVERKLRQLDLGLREVQ